MTAPETMTDCPTEETLAAFIDHRLTGSERARIIEHLADCADCRNVVWMADALSAQESGSQSEAQAVTEVDARFRRWMWPSVAAVAAAAALVLFLRLPRDPMQKLIAASAKLDHRTVSGRLMRFPYKPARETSRGPGDARKKIDLTLQPVYRVAADVAEDLEKDPSARARHDLGVVYLATDQSDQAIPFFRAALQAETQESDVRKAIERSTDADLLNDASVAYFANNEFEIALLAADRSMKLRVSAEAAWNRATALQNLDGRTKDALAAWRQYLQVDPSSAWSAEAQTKIDDLTSVP